MFGMALLWFVVLATSAIADPVVAVGRLEHADRPGTCTAALVQPDIVLTAAHCVRGKDPANYTLRVSDQLGHDPIPVRSFVLHPLYEQSKGNVRWRLRFDLAIAQLEKPVTGVRPFPLATGDEVALGEQLLLISWRRSDGERPVQRQCNVIDGIEGLVTLDCPVRGGESGAPVLRATDTGFELVAVISSKQRRPDKVVAVATDVRLRLSPMLNAVGDGS